MINYEGVHDLFRNQLTRKKSVPPLPNLKGYFYNMAIYYIGSVSVFSFFGVFFRDFSPQMLTSSVKMSFKIKPAYLNTCDLYLYNKYYTNIVNSDYVGANIVNTNIVTLVHYPSSNGRGGYLLYR